CFGETALFMADYRHLKDVTTALKKKKAISKPATYPAELSLPTGLRADVVTCWSISQDGKTLISGDDDNIVTLWDIATGKEVRRFSGHTGDITSLDFSPDGRLIISGSNDKTIRLWDIATGKVLLVYDGFVGKANSLRFLPDGYSFITGSDGRFSSWDIIKEIEAPVTDENASNLPRNCLISSPDIIFSPDRKSIVSEEGSGRLNIYDIASGKELHSFIGHNNYSKVYSICFSPDSKFLLSGSSDSTIKLWDIATGKELKTYVAHAQYINSLSFSPDGKSFISADSHGNLDLWDIASGKEIRSFPDQEHLVNSIHFLPDGKSFITSNFYDDALNLWETSTGRMLRSFEGVSKQVFSFDISKNGKKILVGSDQDVKLADIGTAIRIKSLAGHQNWVFSVSFSPDEKTFISGGLDSTLKYWDIETGKVLRTYTGHKDRIFGSCYSPDNKSFISGSWDRTVKLWDIATGKEIKTFTGHEYRVNCVAFAPDGKSFISGSHDKSIKLWDVTTGNELKTFTGHDDDVWSLAYSPDGRSFISGSGDATIKLWDIASGKELKTLVGHNGSIASLCFSSDGKTILSGSTDKTLKLWDANNGLPLKTFAGHTGTVVGARFHPSGNFIMSFSDDKTLKYWDILSAKEIASLCLIDSIDWVLYTPDKYYAATKNGAKALGWVKGTQIWNFDQWDLQYNRPDIVFSRMPDPDTAMIKLYYKAYQKRLKKMKFSESMFKSGFHTPEIQIEKQTLTAQNMLELDIAAVDTLYSMDRINVWVNDVPVYGINGNSLRNEKQSIGVPVKKQISLALGEGDNKIEISVLNSAGAESLKQTAYAKNENPSVKKDLYFIAISCADYKDNRYNLKYSVKDGRDMARQFAAAGSDFSNIFIDTLFNKNVTRENVAALKEKLLRSKVDDEVILFASGHGLLDDSLDFYFATYDIDFRHPESRGISFDDFENIMD
ncbi:MAG: WD40 repeat domain-containing protein, partial [Bacteroidia bacterium]|nr:WD40 repeat domain-containing protein [Bacteroidia bacterium]